MTDLLRQEIATSVKTLVVKVGTTVLTCQDGTLDQKQIARLAEELHRLIKSGRQVVLVSSGAVGAGMRQLGLHQRPTDLAKLQAVAAVGQAKLIEVYDRTLRKHGRHAAQVLLTADDLNDRTRYLNVRNTILALLQYGAVPIINENDTVSVDELITAGANDQTTTTFGDNDHLAALVTNLIRAPLLIILSNVDGLYDGDPSDPASKLVSTVTHVDESVLAYVRDSATGLSKGGMASKLAAARIAAMAGENVIIAGGRNDDVLARIIEGQPLGTLILAHGKSISPRKRWIGFSAQPRGRVILDAGARRAIEERGSSLLAIGIVEAEGDFDKGDVVSLCDTAGHEFARGLSNYPADEIQRIKGLQTDRIAQVLGHCRYDEVVHRDNMTTLGR